MPGSTLPHPVHRAAPAGPPSHKWEGLTPGIAIEGYASLWGVRDLNDDVVAKGAFAESLREGREVAMLWRHLGGAPVGRWDEVSEDARGLRVRGRVFAGSVAGRLVRSGAVDGLSIGFRTARARRDGRMRVLSGVELWEVSLVAFPMLTEARFRVVEPRAVAA